MSDYGSYTTIDAPTEKEDEALEFLKIEFDKIDARVYRKMNDHDFGGYPTFEVNYPYWELEHDADGGFDEDGEFDGCLTCHDELGCPKLDEWHDKANEIEDAYSKKFEAYL